MATIVERKRKDGSVAYLAQIIIKRKGKTVFQESRTFDRRTAASAWAKMRTKEVAAAGDQLAKLKNRGKTLSDAIERYTRESQKDIGRTKTQVLAAIQEYDIAEMSCDEIKSHDIVEFARTLSTNRSPATVGNYMSHLGAIFAIARPAWGFHLDPQEMKDAFVVCNRLGITGKSKARNRRPTLKELDALMTLFQSKHAHRPKSIPMHKVMAFALFSTRRQEEITRLTWEGLDAGNKRILVTDMKHPGDKVGNDVYCDLPNPAYTILQSMPKTEKLVFPFNPSTISANFTRACKVLDIFDLRFHDLRHEGVSRLFETGLSIPHVAAVSGHRSWSSLQRYTHIRQSGDKYADWKWLMV